MSGTLVTLGFARHCVLDINIIASIYIYLQQYFFCYSVFWGQQPNHIPASLIGLVLLSELECVAVYLIL